MVGSVPINSGRVDWSGENPGIYLRDTDDGPWTRLGLFFRVVYSPHGRGNTMVVLAEPEADRGREAGNICVTDNQEMTRYLIDGWVSRFPSFRGKAGLAAMSYAPLTSVESRGDPRDRYAEVVCADGLELEMQWEALGEPFAAEVAVEHSATGAHEMYSLFVEARRAAIKVNGKPLSGRVTTRQFFGRTMSTAFLAFAETWVTPSQS